MRTQLLPHGAAIKVFVSEIKSRSFEREITRNNVFPFLKIADYGEK